MPIFHHIETHKRFFFIHIPRTGGRFLGENFLSNGFNIEHHLTKEILNDKKKIHDYLWTYIEGVEIPHAPSTIYSKWKNIKSLPSIAVVRNPVNRFFSGSFVLQKNFNQSYVENWTKFKKILSKEILITNDKNHGNWFQPQHTFISAKTNVWKYEDGLGKAFWNWFNNIVHDKSEKKTDFYSFIPTVYNKLKRTNKLISNINRFYKKDFKQFNYGTL